MQQARELEIAQKLLLPMRNSLFVRDIVKELKKYYGVGSPCRTLLYCLRLAALYYFSLLRL